MALGFIKKIFSFGKDEKAAPEAVEQVRPTEPVVAPEDAQSPEVPVHSTTVPELADELTRIASETSHVLHPEEPDVVPLPQEEESSEVAAELEAQAASIAEFREAAEEEDEPSPALRDEIAPLDEAAPAPDRTEAWLEAKVTSEGMRRMRLSPSRITPTPVPESSCSRARC